MAKEEIKITIMKEISHIIDIKSDVLKRDVSSPEMKKIQATDLSRLDLNIDYLLMLLNSVESDEKVQKEEKEVKKAEKEAKKEAKKEASMGKSPKEYKPLNAFERIKRE